MSLRRSAFIALFLFGISGVTAAQVIDCNSDTLNNTEKTICASAPLRSLASRMDRRYQHIADAPGVRQSQLEWIKLRDHCNGNTVCLTAAYRQRNAYLATLSLSAKNPATTEVPKASFKHLFFRQTPAPLMMATPAAPASIDIASATNPLDPVAGPLAADQPTSRGNSAWFLAIILLAPILLWQMLTKVCGKCPNCHHWFAKIEIDQRHFTNDSSVLPIRYRRGLRQRSMTNSAAIAQPIRSHVAAIRHYNQCRMCLHEWETTTRETK